MRRLGATERVRRVRRGEIWWGRPPLPGGSTKERPFLVVSADAFNINERYRKVMVIHLTSSPRAGGPYAWEVALPRGVAGLPAASTAKCAEVYTFFKESLTELIGTLPVEDMRRIDAALGVALSLPP